MIFELPSEGLSITDSRKLDSLFDVLECDFQESASCHGVCYTPDRGFTFGSYLPIYTSMTQVNLTGPLIRIINDGTL